MVGLKAYFCYFKFRGPILKTKKALTQEISDAEMKNSYAPRILGKLLLKKSSRSITQTQPKFVVIARFLWVILFSRVILYMTFFTSIRQYTRGFILRCV